MVSLIVLIGGLFAVLVISTLLYYYKKYKTETEARFLEVRLLLKSAKDHQNHISKQLLDIMKANKDDLIAANRLLEEQLARVSQTTEFKLEDSKKKMMDQMTIIDRRNEEKINALKETFETQLDVLRRAMK
jgi:hypothetical protein